MHTVVSAGGNVSSVHAVFQGTEPVMFGRGYGGDTVAVVWGMFDAALFHGPNVPLFRTLLGVGRPPAPVALGDEVGFDNGYGE